jgi:D-threonate/D-erythronate kinase
MVHTAIIADDLTGANDTAIQFAKHGMRTFVLWDFPRGRPAPGFAEVVVVDTETRAASFPEAYERVREAAAELETLGISRIYKKMDSTLRGNVGAEIRAVADAIRPDLIVIAPAFPRYGRTTVAGHQFVDGQPVSEAEAARDPRSPVSQSFIPALIREQTDTPVGLITTETVAAGRRAIGEAIESRLARGENWIVFDVASQEDLRNIAAAAAGHARVLWVGSTGLAGVLPEILALPRGAALRGIPPGQGAALVIAGSLSATVREQVHELKIRLAAQMICIDPAQALRDPAAEIARCHARGRECRNSNPTAIVISSAAGQAARDSALAEGVRLGIPTPQVGARIAQVLGSITAATVLDGCAGLVVTGGDTAIEVCRALEADSLEVLEEVAPGIPLCELSGSRMGPIRIVTKAGGFGDRDALIKAVRVLGGKD